MAAFTMSHDDGTNAMVNKDCLCVLDIQNGQKSTYIFITLQPISISVFSHVNNYISLAAKVSSSFRIL
jgi:hypothetical protein